MYQYAAIRLADSMSGGCKTIGVFVIDSGAGNPRLHFQFYHRDQDPILLAVVDDIVKSIKAPEDLWCQSIRSGIPFVGMWITSVQHHALPPHEFFKLDLDLEFSSWESR